MAISASPDNLAQSRAPASPRAKAEQCLEHIFCLDGPSVSGILLLLLLIRVWVKNEKVTVGRCINQVAVMEGEIASSEAGRFGLQGARAFAPYSPEMSNLPFLLSSNVIILYHTEWSTSPAWLSVTHLRRFYSVIPFLIPLLASTTCTSVSFTACLNKLYLFLCMLISCPCVV